MSKSKELDSFNIKNSFFRTRPKRGAPSTKLF